MSPTGLVGIAWQASSGACVVILMVHMVRRASVLCVGAQTHHCSLAYRL